MDEANAALPTRIGPYLLRERLAAGGMGEVFLAEAPGPVGEPRTVVVKRLLGKLATSVGARRRFQQEARIAAQVRHPKVVEVLDFGEDERGQPYLVLEYVRGVDLGRLMRWQRRQGAPLELPLALLVACDMLEGLQAVHEARDASGRPLGIVHRDVSPSNVLLSVYGDVKLADFGLAFEAPPAGGSRRVRGRTGKLGYLAPEQVAGEAVGQAADIFAAGVVAAELLMGRPLFTGGSELAILLAVRDVRIEPFVEVSRELPRGLGEAVLRALARRPEARHPSAAVFREQLAAFLSEPEEELRHRLGALVQRVARELRSDPVDPSSTQSVTDPRTEAHLAAVADRSTPATPPAATIASPEAWDAPTRDASIDGATTDLPELQYVVRTADGRQLGPWTYARLVEAIAVGDVGPDDRVSDGGAFRLVRDDPQLRTHLPRTSLTPITTEHDRSLEATRTVDMEEGGWVSALAWSALRRETGLWLCTKGAARKEVYIRDGKPEFVSSNLAGELLGEYLVKSGVISRGELDMALAVMPRFEGKLGETLVALGLVDPVELVRHIATQVRERLLDLFVWTGGTAQFYEGVSPPERGFPLDLDSWELLDAGMARRLAAGLEQERLQGRLLSRLQRVPGALTLAQVASLPEPLRRVLALTSEPTLLPQIVDALAERRDPNRGYRAVLLLLGLGALRWVD